MGVELPGTTGGEDHRVGGEALAAVELDADDASVRDQQVAQQRVLAQLDGRGPDSVAESGLDRRSRRVSAGVQHARDGVGRLQPTREVAVGGAIEVHAPRDELGDAGRALADEDVHGIGSFRPAPAVSVSAACEATVSAGEVTAAIPPCAHRVLVSGRAPFVTTVTRHPDSAACSAAVRPAMPLPTTTTVVTSPRRSAWPRACARGRRSRARRRRPGP